MKQRLMRKSKQKIMMKFLSNPKGVNEMPLKEHKKQFHMQTPKMASIIMEKIIDKNIKKNLKVFRRKRTGSMKELK